MIAYEFVILRLRKFYSSSIGDIVRNLPETERGRKL